MVETRVLIVEDETIVAMDLADSLRRIGLTVAGIVSSGEAAIEAVERLDADLVLMDIRLKGAMDGIEAAQRIRDRHRNKAILFLTSYADAPTVERARFVAPYGYLLKPFDERDLRRTIDLAVSRIEAERARVEETDDALWQSEELFRLLVDAVSDYAMIVVDLGGRIIGWNAGAQRIFGYTEDEIVGQPASTLFPDALPSDRVRSIVDELRTSGRMELEGVRVRKDGSAFLAHAVRTPLSDRQGRVRGFVSVTQDITERRSLEEQLLQAQKLENLGKLAGGIAHDFNNMLMVILSRCDLLMRVLRDEHRRYAQDIKTAANKSRSLIAQLLASARRQVLVPHVIDLNEVVTSTLDLLSVSIGEDIDVRTDIQRPLWRIFADPSKLHQVLLNLVVNARDAMPDGGALTIETRNFRADASYVRQHPKVREGEYVMLAVSDSGIGVPREIRDSIFDPFFTTKAVGSGTGLGLSVARGIVEQTGGHIWLYSEVGQGTTFKVIFPRVDAPAERIAEEVALDLPHRGTETILLVEDEQLLRTILRETLEENGYTVLDCATPAEALERSRTYEEPIHLLLTDVILPGMNGRQLAARLIEQRPGLRAIFMSGYTDNVILHRGVLDPSVRFLEKPVPTGTLLREIRAALDE